MKGKKGIVSGWGLMMSDLISEQIRELFVVFGKKTHCKNMRFENNFVVEGPFLTSEKN